MKSLSGFFGFCLIAILYIACSGTPSVCGSSTPDGGVVACGGSNGSGGDTGIAGSESAGTAGVAGTSASDETSCLSISQLADPPSRSIGCWGPVDANGALLNELVYYGHYTITNSCSRNIWMEYWRLNATPVQYIREARLVFSGGVYSYESGATFTTERSVLMDVSATQPAIPANITLNLDLVGFICQRDQLGGYVVPAQGVQVSMGLEGFIANNSSEVSVPISWTVWNTVIENAGAD